jgi:hypothetical protein
MLKSKINPQAITKRNKAKLSSFSGFMVGRDNLSSLSSISNSANNIVNFSRTSGISVNSDVYKLVSNISTNILTSVDNSIKNVIKITDNTISTQLSELQGDLYSKISDLDTKYSALSEQIQSNSTRSVSTRGNIQQVEPKENMSWIQNIAASIKGEVDNILKNTLRNFSEDYNKRVKPFDDTRPNTLLTKFASLYQNAIGFINYFGNEKNIKVVQDNLKFLRKMFEESFEVAKVLRQTIIKIVKQLSNLPTASPNSGGLNLDINVPGSKLQQSTGAATKNIGRGAKIGAGLGIGALGIGGLAASASGMQSAKEFQQEQLSQSSVSPTTNGASIPEGVVDSFSSIVERFTSAVNNLIEGVKKSSGSSAGEGVGKGAGGGGPTPSPGSADGDVGSGLGGSGQDFATLATIAALESGSAQGQADVAQSVYNRLGDTGQLYGKSITEILTRKGQYQVAFTDPRSSRGPGTEVAKEFKNILGENEAAKAIMYYYSKRGMSISEERAREMYRGSAKAISDARLRENSARHVGGRTEFLARGLGGTGSVSRGGGSDNDFFAQYGSRTQMTRGAQPAPSGLFNSPSETSATTSSTQTTRPTQSTVAPAPAKDQQIQNRNRAQAISTPAQQRMSTISLSPTFIDATQQAPPQQQSVIPVPSSGGGTTSEVPFLPTTNPDNFLTMYSRIVYNIVDG